MGTTINITALPCGHSAENRYIHHGCTGAHRHRCRMCDLESRWYRDNSSPDELRDARKESAVCHEALIEKESALESALALLMKERHKNNEAKRKAGCDRVAKRKVDALNYQNENLRYDLRELRGLYGSRTSELQSRNKRLLLRLRIYRDIKRWFKELIHGYSY